MPIPSNAQIYIDLNRRFADVSQKEMDIDTIYALAEAWGVDRSLGWDDLLKSERVVVLADAGSGKTWEMREQAARLRREGKAALFVPLQMLAVEGLRDCLAMDAFDIAIFDNWLADKDQEAWLFLDAVDELKLTTSTLDLALGRVARDVMSAMSRLRVVISCRPWDWRPADDFQTLMRRLPPRSPEPEALPTGEEAFLAPVREHRDKKDKKADEPVPQIHIAIMLQLNRPQISTFLKAQGIADSEHLLNEIVRQEALPFARRPLDLKRLSGSWKTRGTLGTRLQQHEDDVASALEDRTDRLDAKELPAAESVEGAERLALALTLTKCRALQDIDSVTEPIEGEGVLSPADVLDAWTAPKIAALLRRAIFDPATYGRVQFHHRSVQEFLAARRLFKLRDVNLSKAEIFRLLFADTYGEKVLIPAMRPIAAWLAIWCDDIAREILRREPEVLVQFGDPASLRLEHRRALLHAVVDAYGGGGWRGLKLPHGEMRRLAHTELAPEIRACWEKGASNDEIREFLIELIYLASITACLDIVRAAAFDETRGSTARIWAIRALTACKQTDTLREIAVSMLDEPERWSDRLVLANAPDLFPTVMTTPELLALIRRTPVPRSKTSGFGYSLQHMLYDSDPLSLPFDELRDGLTDLIWQNIAVSPKRFTPASVHSGLAEPLAVICQSQLDAGKSDPALVKAAIVAHRAHNGRTGSYNELDGLRRAVAKRRDLHHAFVLGELALCDGLNQTKEPWSLYFYALANGTLCSPFEISDWDWLAAEAAEATGMPRGALLFAMTEIWWKRGESETERQLIIDLAGDDVPLATSVARRTAPREIDPADRDWEKELAESQRVQIAKEKRAVASWRKWKREADADVAACFTEEQRPKTINVLIQWLGMGRTTHDLARENWRDIPRVLGADIGDRFIAAMRAYWRNERPPLRSEPGRDQHALYHSQTVSLTGLSIETTEKGWAIGLTEADAVRAAEWGTLQLNGLPEWYSDLIAKWPIAVSSTLMREIKAELGTTATTPHPHVLGAVQHGAETIKALLAPELSGLLGNFLLPADVEQQPAYGENIDRLLSVICTTGGITDALAALCIHRLLSDVEAGSASIWLRGAFAAGAGVGLKALQQAIPLLPKAKQKDVVEGWIAALFGDRHARFSVPLKGDAAAILALTRLAYQYVPIREDVDHDGTYVPDVRDDARTGRNTLIGALIDLPGKDAHCMLTAAANDPLFSHIPDRLRLLARERAAKDSDLSPLSAEGFRAWERSQAWLPQTPAELFATMLARLDEIERDIRDHPFNDRHILRDLGSEKAMQPLIAKKVEDIARGAYHVSREDEVADKKEPDIRLLSQNGVGKAAIEIKIGDSWSVRELETALSHQLLNQYLRHPECQVGCLLVTYAGRKGFQHPNTGAVMTFNDVVEHLRTHAAALEASDGRDVKIGVATLDLRDPLAA